MKKKFFILCTPLLSINFIFLMTCHRTPYCTYPAAAKISLTDNSDSMQHPPTSAGVPAKGLLLEVATIDSSYICQTSKTSFVNSAYARSPKDGVTIDSISLISNHYFDAAHPAGADLMDLFFATDTGGTKKYGYHNTLYLLQSPDDTGTHVFTVLLFASDPAKNVTASAPPVKLLP